MDDLVALGLAVAIGLVIGTERGWTERAAPEGSRVAGIRTFGLIGLTGGTSGLLSATLGPLLLGFFALALTGLMAAGYIVDARRDKHVSITTAVAALVTYALGALAVLGRPLEAAAGAVVATTLLALKPVLHSWLARLEAPLWYGALKLLLISVVLLPVLPNRGFGPWQALNPFEIWWMVVLIAALGFTGFVAMGLVGVRRGIVLTGLLGGLVSSTAATLNLARMQARLSLPALICAAVLVAGVTMYARVLIEVALLNQALLRQVVLPIAVMMLIALVASLVFWFRTEHTRQAEDMPLKNPLELLPAIQFGLLLAAILLAAHAARAWLGDTGIYVLALVSGMADVDAITLSLSRMAGEDLSHAVAARAILIAVSVNTFVKAIIASFIGGRELAMRILPATGLMIAGGFGASIF